MNKKWAYYIAVLFLLVLRFGVLNTNYDQFLSNWHYDNAAAFIQLLRNSPTYNEFMGNWGLPFYVACVLVYWSTNEDDSGIPMQFLLLPLAYLPFSIIGTILMTAEFQPQTLWVHPLIILPFGYLYVSFWTIFIWIFQKIRLLN